MKAYGVPIRVESEQGRPVSLQWRRRTCRVIRILDRWVLQSRWWEREERRSYYLLATSAGDLEVYREGDRWILARILD